MTLASLRPGDAALVLAVAESGRVALDREGIAAGVTLHVETAMPFGGPVVVRLGRARVALARRVAASIEVQRPHAGGGERGADADRAARTPDPAALPGSDVE